MSSEREHGVSTKKKSVSVYVGSSKNLKDLKDDRNFWQDLPILSCSSVIDYPQNIVFTCVGRCSVTFTQGDSGVHDNNSGFTQDDSVFHQNDSGFVQGDSGFSQIDA